ncbi:MAG: DUF2834 domain-containing protein [Phormidesmis sp.]
MSIAKSKPTEQTPLTFFYLVFSILSAIIAWGIFSQFLLSGDAAISTFFQQSFATPISTLWVSDVIISAVIFFPFAYKELNRLDASPKWLILYIATLFSIGLCFSLALFFYQREKWLSRSHTVKGQP